MGTIEALLEAETQQGDCQWGEEYSWENHMLRTY
jgi:hypothetical protein